MTHDRMIALEASILSAGRFSGVGFPYRKAAARVASLLVHLDAAKDQAIDLAAEIADAMSGGAASIRHTINGVFVVVEDDGDDFDVCFGGALVAWYRMADTRIEASDINTPLIEMITGELPKAA